jgi:hypothetical protein
VLRPKYAFLAALLALVLAALGCGSDSSLTKAEFIKQADVICKKADDKKTAALEAYLLKIGTGIGKPMTRAQSEYQVKKVLMPPIQAGAEEVSELDAPDGEEEKVNAILSGVEKAVKESEEEAGHPQKSTTGPAFNDPFANVAKLSQEYGFKTCYVNY